MSDVGLVLEATLLTDRYQAAGEDRAIPEWPPHPARIFCALVAGARSDEDRGALRWLERQLPPTIYAASDAVALRRQGYVVTNRVDKQGPNQFHLGRTSALRYRTATAISSPRVVFSWPGVMPDDGLVERLDRLARAVPYLGRSDGPAVVACRLADEVADGPDRAGLTRFEPGEGSRLFLRVPFAGYLDELVRQYDAGRPAWEVSRSCAYRQTTSEDAVLASAEAAWGAGDDQQDRDAVPSVFVDVIVMGFTRFHPDGGLAVHFSEALRRAVMSVTPDPLPAALHGHGAPGHPHVAFIALPDVGHSHADGRLMGMAVALPAVGADERMAIVRGVLGSNSQTGGGARAFRLDVPRIGEVTLEYRPGLVTPKALDPRRWCRGSRTWASTTPIVLDRYPRHGDVEAEVARCCVTAGLPEPDNVVTSTTPLVEGGIRLRPRDLPEHARGRIFRHATVRFPRRVAGPVLLGAGRYLGVGLMFPVADSPATRGGPA